MSKPDKVPVGLETDFLDFAYDRGYVPQAFAYKERTYEYGHSWYEWLYNESGSAAAAEIFEKVSEKEWSDFEKSIINKITEYIELVRNLSD